MQQPLVSVIVPVWRVERYLHRCVDSLLVQSRTALEIILVEDGSPDACGAICDAYARRDERVRVLHQENRGAAAARNAGLEIAVGDYIAFVDGDDYLLPEYIAQLTALAETTGADVVQSGMLLYGGGEEKRVYAAGETLCIPMARLRSEAELWRGISNGCNRLYRAECLAGVRFEEDYPIGEDLLFLLAALQNARSIALGTGCGYVYEQHGGSVCGSRPDRKRLCSMREALLTARERYADWPGLCAHLQTELFRNDMDMCAKICRWELEDCKELLRSLRRELRHGRRDWLFQSGFSPKEQGKMLLIGWLWPIYSFIQSRRKYDRGAARVRT